MTTICLIGYGKMGRMLHQLAPEKGLKVVGMVDPVWDGAAREISHDSLNNADVAIEFSHPSAVLSNLERLLDLNQNCVIGTTGWHQDLPRIVEMAKSSGIGMVYGANFSLGMNLFSRLIVDAVKLFDGFDDYDLMAWEKHHAQKADSPSGTAVELAKLILENSSRKTKVVWDRLQRRPEAEELHFASIRGGKIPGTHVLAFDSDADTIELSHVVRSRATFALGALQAAKWIAGKSGVYSFQDLIADILC